MNGKRLLIKIDEEKCDGCGLCVSACAEGAIAIVDGKARLVSESYCDGLGACLGECPQDAISMEEREAKDFDPQAVHEHLAKHSAKPRAHAAPACGCPGAQDQTFAPAQTPQKIATDNLQLPPSSLGHWPVQLMLVSPLAPYLRNADLIICADCVPFAVADFHQRYLNGKVVLVGCPKLDDLDYYRQKLRQVFAEGKPRRLTVLRMEVPCCSGIAQAAIEARDEAAPSLPLEVHTIGIREGIQRQSFMAQHE